MKEGTEMKTLELKTTEFNKRITGDEKVEFSYKNHVETCIQNPPEKGFSDLEEMRKRTKILDKLDKANGSLKLEDAEADTLKECAKAMVWKILDPAIVGFLDDVNEMK